MANVLFTRTSDPNSKPVTDGQLIFDTSGNGKMYLDNGTDRLVMGGALTVDATLSKTSTNPVQNKAVAGVMLDTLSDIGNVTSKGFLTDALAVKELNTNVNELNNSLGGFSFKTTSGKKQVSTDGGKTWSNFSSGAELLWTNPAPANSFPAQTLSIDLSNYDGIFIISKGFNSKPYYAPVKIFIPKDGKAHICLGNQNDANYENENIGDNSWYSRYVTVTNNGITFTSGYVASGTSGYVNACIPVEIYGTNLTFE